MPKKKSKSFIKWIKWLGLGLVVSSIALGLSVKTYLSSLSREEVLIAEVGGEAVKYSKAGQVRVYYADLNGVYPQGVDLFINTKIVADLNDGKPQIVDTIQVGIGESVTTKLWDHDQIDYKGWVEPNEDDTCGTTSKQDISSLVSDVESAGEPIESIQCWSDEVGSNYNDALLILSYNPSNAGSGDDTFGVGGNSDTDSDSSNNSDSDTKWVVRKYLDANRNGIRETGEAGTNREWQFEYQINGGKKKIYSIEPGDELGLEIDANKGDTISVHELGQADWLNTTGSTVEKKLEEEKLHYFNFGGWPVNGVTTTDDGSFPATQPNTGTPTWLTFGVLLAGLGLLAIKLYSKIKS